MPERLVLKDTQIVKLTQYPGEDGDSQVLGVKAILTRPLATQLGCHDNCFAENGMPRHFVDLKLTGLVIVNCEVVLDGDSLLAHKVQNFKVGRPKTQSETDPSLEVECNLHFSYAPSMSDWCHRKNKATFQTALVPPNDWNAQQSLFDKADPDTQDGDDDEDAVPCIECANGIPFAEGTTSMHDSGQPCRVAMAREAADAAKVEVVAKAPPELEAAGSPALATAREADGGTHAAKRGRGRSPSRAGGVVEIGVGVADPPQPASNDSRPVVN